MAVGLDVGEAVGNGVGLDVGLADGMAVGSIVGADVGSVCNHTTMNTSSERAHVIRGFTQPQLITHRWHRRWARGRCSLFPNTQHIHRTYMSVPSPRNRLFSLHSIPWASMSGSSWATTLGLQLG
jgi:hypothetical protein